jgi:RNA polymerase sigma-70 factor (ECF subfamily)
VAERDNQEWIVALRQPGSEREEALADLRAFLVRGLGYALAKYSDVQPAHLEDFAQDALLKILDGLDSFRGESRFTTWAQKIAVRVALTELRRHRWRNVSLDELTGFPDGDFVPSFLSDTSAGPDEQTLRHDLVEVLQHAIAKDLTDKQRQALVAVRIHGMPIAEVARRMDTNRNALYKLLHDARERLKEALLDQGLSPEEILAAFES